METIRTEAVVKDGRVVIEVPDAEGAHVEVTVTPSRAVSLESLALDASTPTQKPHNIYRIDIEPSEEHPNRHPTHGWQVRIRRHGKQHTKFFSDERAGSGAQALVNALVYRDELLAELSAPDESAQPHTKTGKDVDAMLEELRRLRVSSPARIDSPEQLKDWIAEGRP